MKEVRRSARPRARIDAVIAKESFRLSMVCHGWTRKTHFSVPESC